MNNHPQTFTVLEYEFRPAREFTVRCVVCDFTKTWKKITRLSLKYWSSRMVDGREELMCGDCFRAGCDWPKAGEQ